MLSGFLLTFVYPPLRVFSPLDLEVRDLKKIRKGLVLTRSFLIFFKYSSKFHN